MENTIVKLKKKQQDLEDVAKNPAGEHAELRTQGARPKNQSIAQLIYAENRRKAAEAHATLAHLGPPVDLPLYHQPSDTAAYLRNRAQFLAFRPRLLKFLRQKQQEKDARHRYLTVTYNKWMNEWSKRVGELEKANIAAAATAGAAALAAGAAALASIAVSTSSGVTPTTSSNNSNATTTTAASTAANPAVVVRFKIIKKYYNIFLHYCFK